MLRQIVVAFGPLVLFLTGSPLLSAAEPQSTEVASRNLRQFSRNLFPYHDGNAWGYMDRNGNTVIAPAYGVLADFYDDIAVTTKDLKVDGFLTSSGKFLALSGYDRVFRVSNKLARVSKKQNTLAVLAGHSNRFTFVDLDGKQITNTWYDIAGDFSEGLARVNQGAAGYRGDIRGGSWGYIDTSGKEVIERQFEEAGDFYDGLARVKKGGKWGFIGRNGKFVIEPIYDYALDFSEGLAPVEKSNLADPFGPSWHYLDSKGAIAIAGPYASASVFSEGRASILERTFPTVGEQYYIDKAGKEVIRMGLGIALPFSSGLAGVWTEKEKKWGVIDRDGNWLIKPQFENRVEFVSEIGRVSERGDYRYIDTKNKTVRNFMEP